MVKQTIKDVTKSLKQSGKKIKEYLIDDTIDDVNKIMQNLEPNKKEENHLDEKE